MKNSAKIKWMEDGQQVDFSDLPPWEIKKVSMEKGRFVVVDSSNHFLGVRKVGNPRRRLDGETTGQVSLASTTRSSFRVGVIFRPCVVDGLRSYVLEVIPPRNAGPEVFAAPFPLEDRNDALIYFTAWKVDGNTQPRSIAYRFGWQGTRADEAARLFRDCVLAMVRGEAGLYERRRLAGVVDIPESLDI